MLKKSHVNVSKLDAAHIIANELPTLNWFYDDKSELHSDVHWLFGSFIDARANLPIITLPRDTGENMLYNMTRHYEMMIDGLGHLFKESDATIREYMKCSLTDSKYFGNFLEYAKSSYAAGDKAIYGRYDIALNQDGSVIGPYEFNGDTPVMLFESVNLQNLVSQAIYDSSSQLNNWWGLNEQAMQYMRGKTVATVCALSAIDDLATTESIMQMMENVGAKPYLCDPTDLNHDLLHLEKPFEIDGVHARPDAIFMLLPWEEMVESGSEILANWRSWSHNVKFFEPPWRWFISNKGFFAYLTHLIETEPDFARKWIAVRHIPTYLTPNGMTEFVQKPKIGRLGQNIQVHREGKVSTTEGQYTTEPCVFQPITPSATIDGNTVIGTAWIADGQAATIAFREHPGMVTDLNEEQWVAHRTL